MGLYLPMRLHPMTRGAINNIILRHKPTKDAQFLQQDLSNEQPTEGGETPQRSGSQQEDDLEYLYYFGIVFMKNTVVTIFKNNEAIAVTPADINILINYFNTNKITKN